jgi:predicted RNA-binding protein (virulence factor B family)
VEIKIGMQHASREIALESTQTRDEVKKAVGAALEAGSVLTLTDDRGRTFVVPGDRIAYVEIGEPVERRVGFTP